MANPTLYASREGALYQSYDNYAGGMGFYDPPQDVAGPTMMVQPAQHQQAAFAQFYHEQPVYQPTSMQAYAPPQYAAPPPSQPRYYQQRVFSPQMQHALPPQHMPQPQHAPPPPQVPQEPIQYGPELRGVGIKFGERIDPRSGGMLVYVKRIVKDGPADQCKRIQPGDVLQLIDGEDIYGQGLDVLRNKIPGPAGSMVKLGFRSFAGQLYEVDLQRNAYGDNNQTAQPMVQPQYVSAQRTVMVHPGTQVVQLIPQSPPVQYVHQHPVHQPQYVQYMQQQQQAVQYVQQPEIQYVEPPQYQYVTPQVQYKQAPYQAVRYVQRQQYQPQPYHAAPNYQPARPQQYQPYQMMESSVPQPPPQFFNGPPQQHAMPYAPEEYAGDDHVQGTQV